MKRFLLLALAALPLLASAQLAPLPELNIHPADPAKPIQIIGTKTFYVSDLVPEGSRPATVVTALPVKQKTGRIRYILDYAAYTDLAEPDNAGEVVGNFKLQACVPGTEVCSYPHTEELRNSRRAETAKRSSVKVGGVTTTLLSHRWESGAEIEAGPARQLLAAISVPPALRGVQVRVTVVDGEYSLQAPSALVVQKNWAKKQVAGPFTIPLALCAILLLGFAAAARYTNSGLPEEAPKLLGGLIAVFGLVYAFAPFAMAGTTPPALYGVIAGIGWLASGMYLTLGRLAGRHWYIVTLIFVWIWSILEAGGKPGGALFAQVVLPTLLAIYICSRGVSERLE
ncbi:hypothetical protein [Massilia sp. CF038]|uniref:hypothetical protein n=1 Tax=Massilia sp. CF038 TaxID=1881045 RepID=UPI00091E5BE2|nr:hypothetical protein [Massilia sp. CF038]SHH06094.1 hypothetical protein SAMN05428948_2569 [Massilia sp. CF038]